MFSLEFDEQTWTCRFPVFILFGQFVPCYIRPSAFGHMNTVNLLCTCSQIVAYLVVQSVFLSDILHRM